MANNKRTIRSDEWRKKIQTSMLVNRLYDNSLGKIELTQGQLKSIEILLRKTLPDLKAVELYGKDGGVIQHEHNISQTDKDIINQFLNKKKETKNEL